MFNLERAITAWREQMINGGIKAQEVLDELESHLRDDVERQVRAGMGQHPAFDAAVQRIGRSKDLQHEFRKVSRHRARGFRDNPLSLNIVAIWLVLMGLKNLSEWHMVLNGFRLPNFSIGQTLFATISILVGIGLLGRKSIFRICAIALLALNIAGNLYTIAAHGFSGSVYVYAPHIPVSGETVRYIVFGVLPVSYPVFYGVLLLNAFMLLFGLFVLTKPSIRTLFRPGST